MLGQIMVVVAVAGVGAGAVHKLEHRAGVGTTMPAPPPGVKPQPRRPTRYGVNLTTLLQWNNERAFMNLVAGGSWSSATASGWHRFDPARVDRDGTILSLQPAEQAVLSMSFPPASHLGDVAIHCTFEGRGEVQAFNAKGSTPGRATLDFVWPKGNTVSFLIDKTDPADPVRHIDCREAGADRRALFDPLFIESVRPYQAVRFQGWQPVNENSGGDWSRRTLPSSVVQTGPDGAAVEHMVALCNQAHVDPWFTMSWHADATYMANFARYVHDHLDRDRTVYVEIGNETWNYGMPLASQVLREARAEQLDHDLNVARMDRYAEHAVAMFKIWHEVYGADRGRVVRVLAGQAVYPDLLKLALQYRDTAANVDAVAMAPYFGFDFLQKTTIPTSDTDALFRALPEAVDQAADFMRQDKALADSYGLRLIAYEAGQHLTYDGPDTTLIARLNRDSRMGDLYRRYLAAWDAQAGDLMMLFGNITPISRGAAWGLAEYPGQAMAETPKRRVVLEAIASHK